MIYSTRQTLKAKTWYSVLLLSLFSTFVGCKKEETDTSISFLRVVNASPALATYNAYLNGIMVNSAALPFGGASSYGSHSPGSYSLKFTTASDVESLLTKSLTLNVGAYQSFYLIDRPGKLDGITLGDDLTITSADKAYIRFINLSPDAPALDLFKAGATSALISGKTYKTASGFIAIDPGTVSLDVKDTSTGLVKTSLTGTTFTAGYHYDVICGGLVAPANDTERALSIQNILIK